jgi:hypothetical protein
MGNGRGQFVASLAAGSASWRCRAATATWPLMNVFDFDFAELAFV